MKLRHFFVISLTLVLFLAGWIYHPVENQRDPQYAEMVSRLVSKSLDVVKVSLAARTPSPVETKAAKSERVTDGLQLLYDFRETTGPKIRDRSGVGTPMDLTIGNASAVERTGTSLIVKSPTILVSAKPATKLTEAVRQTGEFTLEAWIKPAKESQSGPARIVTLSLDSRERNFTLGQDGNRYDVRFLTNSTDRNGLPSLAGPKGQLGARLTHVVYSRERSGQTVLYLDGKPHAQRNTGDNLKNWDSSYRFALANELSNDRAWLGEFHLVAAYNRALSPAEVRQNLEAGANPEGDGDLLAVESPPKPKIDLPTVKLPGGNSLTHVDFERHVMGILTRQGCNTGSCHGSLQGESDMALSLFGHAPEPDYFSIIDESFGPFADPLAPEKSALLRKPTLLSKHKGGEHFSQRSWQYKVLRNWIQGGAEYHSGSGDVVGVEISPPLHRFSRPGKTVRLKVEATFADGTREDVTPFSKFEIEDDFVAVVNEDGQVRAQNPGDTAIVVSYRDEVVASRALVATPIGYLEEAKKWLWNPGTQLSAAHYIDREIGTKLDALNIEPSAPATDGEFLRRVYIDTIGRLPSPDETRTFLANRKPDKRAEKIDELLRHPLHAALWATKFSDITGNNSSAMENPGEKRSKMWHDWFRDRIAENVPYTDLVRGVILATSRDGRSIDRWIQDARKQDEGALRGFENSYAKRETLDLFWQRRNMTQELYAEQTAAAFLGVQLQCAQCHKHPYDRWTQADYRAYANVFGQVKNDRSSEARKQIDSENNRRKKVKVNKKNLPNLREVFVDTERPNRLKHPETNQPLPPTPLGAEALEEDGDFRIAYFDWLTQPENPFFARSFVNRVWAHYMGIGIVEPVDGFSAANPPSNEKLLAALAEDFVSSNYDMRHLERQILNSQAYQRSSMPNETNQEDKNNYARKYPRQMMAEVVVDVLNSALGKNDEFTRDAPKGSSAIEVAGSRIQDGNLAYVFSAFGRPTRTAICDCERSGDPALPQTLYLMTDSRVYDKIRNGRLKEELAKDNRLGRLKKKELGDSEIGEIVEQLFLSTLTRFPDEIERQAAIANVRKQDGSEAGFVDVFWALINTREFILNH